MVSRLAVGSPPPARRASIYRVSPEVQQHDRVEGCRSARAAARSSATSSRSTREYEHQDADRCRAARGARRRAAQLEISIDGVQVKRDQRSASTATNRRFAVPVHRRPARRRRRRSIACRPTSSSRCASRSRIRRAVRHRRRSGAVAAALSSVTIVGPHNANGAGRHAEPAAACSSARPRRPAQEARLRHARFSRRWRAAPTAAVADAEHVDGADGVLSERARATAAASTTASSSALRRLLVSPEFLFRIEADVRVPRRSRRRTRVAASATSSWRRGCRSSCGAAFRTMSCSTRRAGHAAASRRARAAGAAHAGRSARRDADQQFRRAVAAAAQPRNGRDPARTSRSTSTRRCGEHAARDRAVLRQHHPREPRRDRAAHRRLHVRQRAAGASTTASRTSRAATSGASRCRPTARAAACSGRAAS